MDTMLEIYQRVENLLREKNLKKIDLTKATGIPDSSIRAWHNGVIPNVINAYKVAQFLGITVEELVTGEHIDKVPEKPQAEPSIRLSYMEAKLLERYQKLDDRDREIILSLADVMQNKYRGIYSVDYNR